MLEFVPPGILPIVEDLAAEHMAPDAPCGGAPGALQMLVAGHQVVETLDLERGVVEAGAGRQLGEEQRVVIGRRVAAVAAHEGADREPRRRLDLVGGDEAEARLVPRLRPTKVRDVQHHMTETPDARGPLRDAHGRAQAAARRDRIERGFAVG